MQSLIAERALMWGRLHQSIWLALFASTAMLGGALLFQYVGGLYPCQMCIWQRIPHGVIIGATVMALLMTRSGKAPRAHAMMRCVVLLFLVSAGLGLMHMGVEQKWWVIQTSCTATGGADLNAIMQTKITRCDDIAWSLFGISMAGYNMLLSGAMAALLIKLLKRC
jgi:disulfide bond formation protein DsbB